MTGTWTYPPLAHFRSGNSLHIFDENNFLAAGGSPSNDSLLTIVSTKDGAATQWGVQIDSMAGEIHDMEFVSGTEGFAVGLAGIVMRTVDKGDHWSPIALTGTGPQRDFLGLDFISSTLGIMVGGLTGLDPVNLPDSMQTIYRTTNGGISWTQIMDQQGPRLRDVAFAPGIGGAGIAVGDSNVILRSTDNGLSWNAVSAPLAENRVLNAVWFNSYYEGYIVGGMPWKDSVQTVLHTADGGKNWSVVWDVPAPMLNDVHFYSNSNGFMVGDDDVIFSTHDGGHTWNPVSFPSAFMDGFDLRAVRFVNPNLGMIVGFLGKCLIYKGNDFPAPSISPKPVLILDPNTAEIQAGVNANGGQTTITLEYGTTTSLGTSANLTPGSALGYGITAVSAVLTGLSPQQVYYYKITASSTSGSTDTGILQFYTQSTVIPNLSFETWDSTQTERLNIMSWTGNPVRKLNTGCSSSSACELNYVPGTTVPGAFFTGYMLADNSFGGGVSYTVRPDTLEACVNYSIAAGDTARVFFKLTGAGGTVLADDEFTLTGNSGGYVTEQFPISYVNPANAELLSLAFVGSSNLNSASVLTVDQMAFIGGANIPNTYLENWGTFNRHISNNWYSLDDERPSSEISVSRDSKKVHGKYSLKLANRKGEFGYLTSGTSLTQTKFAVSAAHQTFNGYMELHPMGGDVLNVEVKMYQNGSLVGEGNETYSSGSYDLDPFSVNINYFTSGSQPDSASIWFGFANANSSLPSASYVNLDALSFDALSVEVDEELTAALSDLQVYPNPASEVIHLDFFSNETTPASLTLIDMFGREMLSRDLGMLTRGDHNLEIRPAGLASGIYYIRLLTGRETAVRKLILE